MKIRGIRFSIVQYWPNIKKIALRGNEDIKAELEEKDMQCNLRAPATWSCTERMVHYEFNNFLAVVPSGRHSTRARPFSIFRCRQFRRNYHIDYTAPNE